VIVFVGWLVVGCCICVWCNCEVVVMFWRCRFFVVLGFF